MAATDLHIDIGIAQEDRADTAEGLSRLLADTYTLYVSQDALQPPGLNPGDHGCGPLVPGRRVDHMKSSSPDSSGFEIDEAEVIYFGPMSRVRVANATDHKAGPRTTSHPKKARQEDRRV